MPRKPSTTLLARQVVALRQKIARNQQEADQLRAALFEKIGRRVKVREHIVAEHTRKAHYRTYLPRTKEEKVAEQVMRAEKKKKGKKAKTTANA